MCTLWRTVKRRWGQRKVVVRVARERRFRNEKISVTFEMRYRETTIHDLSWDHRRMNKHDISSFSLMEKGKLKKKKKKKKNDTSYSAYSRRLYCATSSGSLRSIAIWMTRGIQMEGRIVSPLCLANVTISNSVAIKLSRAFGFCHWIEIFWRYFCFHNRVFLMEKWIYRRWERKIIDSYFSFLFFFVRLLVVNFSWKDFVSRIFVSISLIRFLFLLSLSLFSFEENLILRE